MAAHPRESANHSRSVRAAAAYTAAYSTPLWRQSSRRRSRPSSPSTAASLISLRQQLRSPLRLTPHRCHRGAAADPLSDCGASTPSFRPSCGPKSPLVLGPGQNLLLPLPHFACPPPLPQRGPPLARPRQKLNRLQPDRVSQHGPHSSGLTQPPTLAPAPVHTPGGVGGGRKRRMNGEGGPGAPLARCCLFPLLGGRPGAGAVLRAPPPATVFKEPPTPWGAACLTHRRGHEARQANWRDPTTHVARAAAPLSPKLPHPGCGTDCAPGPNRTPNHLPRLGEASGCLGFLSLSVSQRPVDKGCRGSRAPPEGRHITAGVLRSLGPPQQPRAEKTDTRPGPLRGTPAHCSPPLLLDRRNAARGTGTSWGRPA
ncbi:hypothetical protein NDU88_005401 [Pleurodeles waltl]|uniref:Uncharacterized protein n=1 Tax=Pleurodeles waltl TaxID=8319 RepID=A0AAV7RJI7_PLEWA|nr:hypothetical protein NDU88_005401 [Pleurodeles waltl]